MIKTRKGKTEVGSTYHDWTTLGDEFHVGKKWYVVCQCRCNYVNVVCVYDLITDNNKSCGTCGQLKVPAVEIGDKFGHMTASSSPYYDRFRKGNRWRVDMSCECGWTGDVSAILLLRDRVHHSGCKFYCQGEDNGSWKGCGDLSGSTWSQIRKAADLRGLDLELTIEEAWNKYETQQGKCAITGWDINIKREPVVDWWKLITGSLDRIDSSLPYTHHNTQWVHKHINVSKWAMPQQLFIDMCHLVCDMDQTKMPEITINILERYKSFSGVGNLSATEWNHIKQRSASACGDSAQSRKHRHRNKPLTIEIEDGWKLYVAQNGRCALSGVPIYFGLKGKGYSKHTRQDGEATASLDRIDSEGGYEIGNVQWVHVDVNRMKMDYTCEYFKTMCRAVANTHAASDNVSNMLLPKKFEVINKAAARMRAAGPSTGQYKGVSWSKKIKHYVVMGQMYGKQTFLGHFKDQVEAAKNYDWHAKRCWDNCYLNFPDYDYSSFVPKRQIMVNL